MKRLSAWALAAACTLPAAGCSQEAQVESKEALEAVGEDVKEGAKKVGNVLEAAGEKAKEEFSEPAADPDPGVEAPVDGPDADAVPESQEAPAVD
jgi:hypothetical protein